MNDGISHGVLGGPQRVPGSQYYAYHLQRPDIRAMQQASRAQVQEPLPGQYENTLMINTALAKMRLSEISIDQKITDIKTEIHRKNQLYLSDQVQELQA